MAFAGLRGFEGGYEIRAPTPGQDSSNRNDYVSERPDPEISRTRPDRSAPRPCVRQLDL